jgi:putative acetyltransferase
MTDNSTQSTQRASELPDTMRIREATSTDRPELLRVHKAAIRGVEPGSYSEYQLDAWEAAQDDPSQYPVDDSTQYLAVAETEDGTVVGFVGIDVADGVLETLYVDPAVGGQGVGSALLRHGEALAREQGCNQLVMAASKNAVSFYEQFDYERQSETFDLDMGSHVLEFVRMEKTVSDQFATK